MVETVETVTPPPSWLLALSEWPRAMFDLASLPFAAAILGTAPRGDGHPVLLLPGFLTSDASMALLCGYLRTLGYDARTWQLGRNLGPHAIGHEGERLIARIEDIHAETGRNISLVGWSLGGVMSRAMGFERPQLIRQVITLGSPFRGHPASTNAWGIYQRVTGQSLSDPYIQMIRERGEMPPDVPMTAIFSRQDGIAPWQSCVEVEGVETDNIEVTGSHCGMSVNAAIFYAVADRLAQAEGAWGPFDRSGWRALAYPSSGHMH